MEGLEAFVRLQRSRVEDLRVKEAGKPLKLAIVDYVEKVEGGM